MKKIIGSIIAGIIFSFTVLTDANAENNFLPYNEVRNFSEGLAPVSILKKNDKGIEFELYGFMDEKAKEVIAPKYGDVGKFSEGLAKVQLEGKWGFIDQIGKLIVSNKYDEADKFKNGLAAVRKNGKWGYINTKGKEVVKPQYDKAYAFSYNLGAVKKNGHWSYINKKEQRLLKRNTQVLNVLSVDTLLSSTMGNGGILIQKEMW